MLLLKIKKSIKPTTIKSLKLFKRLNTTEINLNKKVEQYPCFEYLDKNQEIDGLNKFSGYVFKNIEEFKKGKDLVNSSLEFNDLDNFYKVYNDKLIDGEKKKEVKLCLAGRIMSIREASKNLRFFDLQINHSRVQLVASKANYLNGNKSFLDAFNQLKKGDIIRTSGFVGKTQSGQLSLYLTKEPEILTPIQNDLPLSTQLGDTDKRFRSRYLDFLLNNNANHAIRIRAKVLSHLRRYLDVNGFIEVETPILSGKAGGANATPFLTSAKALDDQQLSLRIAPELYLKQMIIGGFDKVYEIGKVFRNESMDATHNPEFTTLEFYMAYGNLDTLFDITEKLLKSMVFDITGSYKIKIGLEDNEKIINFEKPFKKIHIVNELESLIGQKLPDVNGDVLPYIDLFQQLKLPSPSPPTLSKHLDKLISYYIEPLCHDPTFLYGHPISMSPLAKKLNKDLSARFELFIDGKELANAYEELNDPIDQTNRFENQNKDRLNGDIEAQLPDQDFCQALTYGLPPTVGFGLGLDRLITLLTNTPTLRETLTFPLMKPKSL